MCGIIACLTEAPAAPFLVRGLRLLEYRGYDSIGVAVLTDIGATAVIRSVNRVDDLETMVEEWAGQPLGSMGLGHTRWATHGAVTPSNAHPHQDCTGRISIVHNGIIDNADALRHELSAAGHEFASAVDSEVISHLLEDAMDAGHDLLSAMRAILPRLSGSWAIVAMDAGEGRTVGTAHGSPLLVGTSSHGAFLASDVSAINEWVDQFQPLEDGDIVELATEPVWMRGGHAVAPPRLWSAERSLQHEQLDDHPDFMHREIDEQPEVAARILDELVAGIPTGSLWRNLGLGWVDRVAVVGCGTSLNAASVVARTFGRLGEMPHQALVASEAVSAVIEQGTLVMVFSQSGETADIMRAVDHIQGFDASMLAVTNNPHSSLARRSDSVVTCRAGTEIGVAATKTFTAQVVTGVCVALSGLVAQHRLERSRAREYADDLRHLPDMLAQALAISKDVIPPIAHELIDPSGFLFLGRGPGVAYAEEGALKLKELTYRWAEAYPAGELKHGPLALVESGTPVIVVDNDDRRLRGNIAEVEARGGRVIRIGTSGSTIPALGRSMDRPLAGGMDQWGPLESVIPMQVLARELALALGRDVDKPRNLAKSVTVD
ncbi:glutamine--fructose-6-phosphate transaminase (isomerizing) [Salinibacterium sp. NK8237]|uniref:glutamine--fructose-6-phosphate transaminase (isomerizing) n=1 Tax=Salinibacterium sp. NK8237 TaxID=2792038 RepID=UPI0018CE8535|nr:glutamine--fructose-6-phosphate transaminase (isomerizing) [Salinibacterium sp. NK8237]MBH0131070.1 glutamine--fructose-6-phosphate transaminase (isomerizing) [Salinibacterium sp. NK8237]